MLAPISDTGWGAQIGLELVHRGGRTILLRNEHRGPLYVQRPFYPEGDRTCHIYLLHPPGGVVGGDVLDIAVDVRNNGRTVFTTPAATKFYRTPAAHSTQTSRVSVADGARLEWLPGESILFDGAHVELSTLVELSAAAQFCGWEIVCLGRPACGEGFARGAVRQRLEIWRAGRPLFIERSRLQGEALTAPWGLAGMPVVGTLVCVLPHGKTPLVDLLRQQSQPLLASSDSPASGDRFSVTQIDCVVVCRYLGASTERARVLFTAAWQTLRTNLWDAPAVVPRIWAT